LSAGIYRFPSESPEPFLLLLFDIQTGVAGDMVLGALFDLGLDFQTWNGQIEKLGFPQSKIVLEKVSKQGILASRFSVQCSHEHIHRGLSAITEIIAEAKLPDPVVKNSIKVFTRLAGVEARIHGVAIEQVHFHEVGAMDAIIDIVGACLGFYMLGITEFFTTPFTFGTGTVQTAHGRMAVPVPATLALSEGFPSRRTDLPGELCTPTGTAIVSALAKPLPADWMGTVVRAGYGAGSRDLPGMANVLRLCLLDPVSGNSKRDLIQVECNLDNMTAELAGHAMERLFAAGCNDAWQEAIFMKKNRLAIKICALVETPSLEKILGVFASETPTGGMRYFPVRRLVGIKGGDAVDTRFGKVELKRVEFPGYAVARLLPEYESCRKLALLADVPLQEIYREALALAARMESSAGSKDRKS
jgi:pyridinium-3,5-bisthiocarboxylic acid mononucleotide nickel chelatase